MPARICQRFAHIQPDRRAWLRLLLLGCGIIGICCLSACGDLRPVALGSSACVGLVTSFSPADSRVSALTALLQEEVQMVRPESRFDVETIPISGLKSKREWKCLAFLTDLDERYLESRHGIHLQIPRGYVLAEDSGGQTVRLCRALQGEPARFVLIHWLPQEDSPRTPEDCLELRDQLGQVTSDGDRVLWDSSSALRSHFQGEPAYLLQGVWQNERYTMGGPFRSFGFRRGDRFFLLDASDYNPPGPKLPLLRETLAITETFRLPDPL